MRTLGFRVLKGREEGHPEWVASGGSQDVERAGYSAVYPMNPQARAKPGAGELTEYYTPIKVTQTLLTICTAEADRLIATCGALLSEGSANAWRSRW
jgi:hypothetical protein